MFDQLKAAIARSRERAHHRQSYRALLELEDHFLKDIGMTRDEVRGHLASRNIG